MEHDRTVPNAHEGGYPMNVSRPVPPACPSISGADKAALDRRIVLYDTTLRDGAQMQGVDFSVADKQFIAAELDRLGVDYVEGGWPGANPTDDAFFANKPLLRRATPPPLWMAQRPGGGAPTN